MSMLEVFKKFYEELTTALPINDMTEKLYSNSLLPGNQKAKVQSLSTPKEKAQHFLDAVIRQSLEIGYTEQFDKLISIMKSSDDPTLKHLAKRIREHSGKYA